MSVKGGSKSGARERLNDAHDYLGKWLARHSQRGSSGRPTNDDLASLSLNDAETMQYEFGVLHNTLLELKRGLIGFVIEDYDTASDDALQLSDTLFALQTEIEQGLAPANIRATLAVAEDCVRECFHNILGGVSFSPATSSELQPVSGGAEDAAPLAELNALIQVSAGLVERVQLIVALLRS